MAQKEPLLQIHRTPPASRPAGAPATVEWPAVAGRLLEMAARRGVATDSRCELCGAAMAEDHGHLADLTHQGLWCVCRPCHLLFSHEGAGGGRFRAVPDRYEVVRELEADEAAWQALDFPIGLAFLFRRAATGRVAAFYPSPAGATESALPLEAWDALVRIAPSLATLTPDVEALLVRIGDGGERPGSGSVAAGRSEALIVPIDACYELVGRIRRTWQGLQGGDRLGEEIDGFFARARARAGRAGARTTAP